MHDNGFNIRVLKTAFALFLRWVLVLDLTFWSGRLTPLPKSLHFSHNYVAIIYGTILVSLSLERERVP